LFGNYFSTKIIPKNRAVTSNEKEKKEMEKKNNSAKLYSMF